MNDFNAADRKSVQKRNKEVSRWKIESQQVVRDLMATPYGRRWVWEKIGSANVFSVNPDKDTVLFTEGQRSVGNALMVEVMEACPEQFMLAMREANARSNSTSSDPGSDSSTDADSESFPDA